MFSPPAMVEVAFVEVALNVPNVGVDVAEMTPDALVERREFAEVPERVTDDEKRFVAVRAVVEA